MTRRLNNNKKKQSNATRDIGTKKVINVTVWQLWLSGVKPVTTPSPPATW